MSIFDDLTWTCEICKRCRPDPVISVVRRPLRGHEDKFPDVRFNLKYCIDNYDCVLKAHEQGPWPEEES